MGQYNSEDTNRKLQLGTFFPENTIREIHGKQIENTYRLNTNQKYNLEDTNRTTTHRKIQVEKIQNVRNNSEHTYQKIQIGK